jgi:hypothetical protein
MTDGSAARKSIAGSAKEAIVIIFSILVAFSLDAWWEDVQVDRDVEEILRAVQSEMSGNLENLDASIQHHSDIQLAIGNMLEESMSGDFTPGVVTTAVVDVEIFEPNSGAMDTLITAGLLGDVDDSELRLLLGSYAAVLQDLNEQEVRSAELRDAVRRRIASIGIRIWIPADQSEAREDNEALNLLAMRSVEENNSIASAQALQEHIRKILTRLEELT